MIGSDDVLACFIAGNAFTWDDWFRLETMDDSLQPTIDMLLNVSVFMWFGAVCPWHSFVSNDVIPIYRLVPLGLLVLLFRRLPMVLLFHYKIPQIQEIKHAVFVGFFGPIGVSAVFYLYIAREFLRGIEVDGEQRRDAARLSELLNVVIWFLTACSIFVHGLSIPTGKLGLYLPRTISTALSSERGSIFPSLSRDRSESRAQGTRPDAVARTSRRRRLASGDGDSEAKPASLGWLPSSMVSFRKRLTGDRGRNESSDEGQQTAEPPKSRPVISSPRDARLIGNTIDENHDHAIVPADGAAGARNADDISLDGPRVHAESPPGSPHLSAVSVPDEQIDVQTSARNPNVPWQRSIRFPDELARKA